MPRSVKVSALLTLGLAILLFPFFEICKHAPALSLVNAFAEDPYDAVGSFGIQLAPFLSLLAVLRAFRPYPSEKTRDRQQVLFARAAYGSSFSVAVTLGVDMIAMLRHPSLWLGVSAGYVLAALLGGMVLLTVLVLWSLSRLARPLPLRSPSQRWTQASAFSLAGLLILVLYPEALRQSILRAAHLPLPARPRVGPAPYQVVWQPARTSAILDILHNPAYAGAYVYGRKQFDPACRTPAHPRGGRILQPIDKWDMCLHNRYPAYIAWEEFVANQAQLRANSLSYREEQPGMARKGQALTSGIVRCGRCGALLHLHYSSRRGEFPVYRCSADQSQFGGTDCQHVRALALDTQVEQRLLEALQPDQVTLALAALAQLEQEEQAESKQWELHLREKWKIPTVKLNRNERNPAQWEDGSYSVEGGSRKAGSGPEHDFHLAENGQARWRAPGQRHALEDLFDRRRCHPTSRMASTS